MDQSTHNAQQNREHAREALTQKIELLEERVRDSVEEAKASVKRKLSLSYHMDRRPLRMLGLSLLTGYIIGRVLAPDRISRHGRHSRTEFLRPEANNLRGRVDSSHDGMSAIKGAATGVVTSVAVQLIKEAVSTEASKLRNSRFGKRAAETRRQRATPDSSTQSAFGDFKE